MNFMVKIYKQYLLGEIFQIIDFEILVDGHSYDKTLTNELRLGSVQCTSIVAHVGSSGTKWPKSAIFHFMSCSLDLLAIRYVLTGKSFSTPRFSKLYVRWTIYTIYTYLKF